MYHFRTAAGREVDIVMERPLGEIVGIEVKAGVSVRGEDLKGLAALKEVAKAKFKRGIVLYAGQEVVPFAANTSCGFRLSALELAAGLSSRIFLFGDAHKLL